MEEINQSLAELFDAATGPTRRSRSRSLKQSRPGGERMCGSGTGRAAVWVSLIEGCGSLGSRGWPASPQVLEVKYVLA